MKQLLISILLCAFGIISQSACGQSASSFSALIVDFKTKAPVSDARIILAKKVKDKPECIINTSLSAISKENGGVSIPSVPPGEYVIFYNLAGNADSLLKDRLINYDPVNHGDVNSGFPNTVHISRSLGCPVKVMPGGKARIVDGNLVADGYLYAEKYDLGMISKDGTLMEVNLPLMKDEELTIEIDTEIGKK